MRGLWRTLALMAEDANLFNSLLAALASQVQNQNLTNGMKLSTPPAPLVYFDLQLQPTPAVLQAIDGYLRSVDSSLILCAYELSEVNRIVCETRGELPPHKNLKAYWQGLGPVGPQNRNIPGFMEAVGALSIDRWTRSEFAAGHVADLNKWFDLSGVQPGAQQALRSALVASSPSDIAASAYFMSSWDSHTCTSVVTMGGNWVHINA
jgi:hypothetical protein